MEMTVSQAQSDMRRGYLSGAAGMLAPALAIVAAGAAIRAAFGVACVARHRGGMQPAPPPR